MSSSNNWNELRLLLELALDNVRGHRAIRRMKFCGRAVNSAQEKLLVNILAQMKRIENETNK